MKSNWKDMTGKEKVLHVASLVLAAVAAVFAVLDFAEVWDRANIFWTFSFAAMCAIDGWIKWNESRKLAIVLFVCGAVMLVFGFVSVFAPR
jgi:RsiW-degrading membrane proteinase PrsW (M82 family)